MKALSTLALATVAALAVPAPAAQAQTTQVGTLTCEVAPGVGLVVASRKEITCTFQRVDGALEVYDGAITRIGVDIGITGAGVIVWSVFNPSTGLAPGALGGAYVGAGAQATVGAGLGANALLGGFRRSVTLQPLSISGQSGLNVAGGVAEMTLNYRPPEPAPRRRR